MKIHKFTDLIAWQKAHSAVLIIYKRTLQFPKEELYCLTSQLRRAALSITSNIAEGFSRHSKKEKNQFNYISLGSLSEVQNQLLLAKDLGYISISSYDEMYDNLEEVSKLINSLIYRV